MNKKEFSNPELKKLIFNLITENNLIVDDIILNAISKSSKTHYDTLLKYYNDIKYSIIENIINSNSKSSDDNIFEIKEIEIFTENNNLELSNIQNELSKIKIELSETKTDLYHSKHLIANYQFKISELKKNYKLNIKKNKMYNSISTNDNSNTNNSSDDEFKKEHRTINYQELTELSSINIINQLKLLSRHELKQLYNKYFSKKLERKLDIYNN